MQAQVVLEKKIFTTVLDVPANRVTPKNCE